MGASSRCEHAKGNRDHEAGQWPKYRTVRYVSNVSVIPPTTFMIAASGIPSWLLSMPTIPSALGLPGKDYQIIQA